MGLLTRSSPHTKQNQSTSSIMRWVILLCIPGLIAQTYFFGWGNLHNVLLCSITAVLSEAAILALRKRRIGFYLSDYSALLTGVLLGIALPPLAPWWISVIAASFSIIFVKQLYGGLGYNPFNPAMAGYALVLISFPLAMTSNWASPTTLQENFPSVQQTLASIWEIENAPDGYSGATPLDVYKHEVKASTYEAITSQDIFGSGIVLGWEWVNVAFLLGGLGLLALRIIPWQTPAGVLLGLALPAILFSSNPDQAVPLSIHLLAGATMFGAFFIATDPVSSSTTPRGRFIFGLGVGLFTYIIRTWGSYPDAIAFAVLLMNFAAPLIDVYTQPRTFGHNKA
ncbi:electron transport complex subunit RsxD, partial [Oleiphilus sp. HI0066]|uniref:electron transport complex subunit RsxD n=3 Tax=Oleiphilus TaxID=141450 RepID=UPI0007C3CA0B